MYYYMTLTWWNCLATPLICLTAASSAELLLTKFAVTAMANLASKDRRSKPSIGTFLPDATTKNLNSYWLSISLSGDTRALHPDPFSSGSKGKSKIF